MTKGKVAPIIARDDRPAPQRKRHISFEAAPSISKSNVDGAPHDAPPQGTPTPPVPHAPIPRERNVVAKTASCPGQVFARDARAVSDHSGAAAAAGSRDLRSRRKRAHSLPAGSLASNDFFVGGPANASTGGEGQKTTLAQLNEEHSLRNDSPRVSTGVEQRVEPRNVATSLNEQRRVDTAVKSEIPEDTAPSAKCGCIIL